VAVRFFALAVLSLILRLSLKDLLRQAPVNVESGMLKCFERFRQIQETGLGGIVKDTKTLLYSVPRMSG
jgi:hypothetical protein